MAISKSSTQKYLDIVEIRDGVVILKDGTLREVILCSSVNFSLKSEDEQNALIGSYMEFLNSLDNPLQIVIQSRALDIDNYIRRLKDSEKKQTNELLKDQINGYIEYVQELVKIGEIMTKKFFIVVPFDPLGAKAKSFWTRFTETLNPSRQISIKRDKFTSYKRELDLRVGNIQANLKSMGLDNVVLDTQGLIELYYNVYNPKTSSNERLGDISQLRIES